MKYQLIAEPNGVRIELQETLGFKDNQEFRRLVADVVERLRAALQPEYVVLGGGNLRQLDVLPPGCRAGDNANAFKGGFRMWEQADDSHPGSPMTLKW